MIGPKPVSSSLTTAPATKAVAANMKNRPMIRWVWPMTKGLFLWTLAVSPMLIRSLAMNPKTIRKKTPVTIQNSGWRSWWRNSKAATLPNMGGLQAAHAAWARVEK